MDKFRQSFALEEAGGYLKHGGDEQMIVRENAVLAFVMGASEQDCKTVSKLPRTYLATVDVSSTHDTQHDPHVNGVAKYELTIRGGAWYVFKPDEPKPDEPWHIVEVQAGSAILIKGECYKWEYFLLRPDLLRPGPTELGILGSIKRVTATITYGEVAPTVPSTVEEVHPKEHEVETDPVAHSEPSKKTSKEKKRKSAKDTLVPTAGGTALNNYWLEDIPNGKQVGPFQPTHCIQAKAAECAKISPGTTFRFQDNNKKLHEVHIASVGRWFPVKGNQKVQRVIIARIRTLEKSVHGWRPVPGWDSLKVVPANSVRTRVRGPTHTQTQHTHKHTRTHSYMHTHSVTHKYTHTVSHTPATNELMNHPLSLVAELG